MKFGEMITAVASLAVVYILLFSGLFGVMITVNTYGGLDIATIISVLVASLIVGYVFAGKIKEESRIGAIGRIVVLSTVVLTLFTMALLTNPYVGTVIEETLESMFSTSVWTTLDWITYSQLLMLMIVALNVVFDLVFGFVELYAGSMLRKATKKVKKSRHAYGKREIRSYLGHPSLLQFQLIATAYKSARFTFTLFRRSSTLVTLLHDLQFNPTPFTDIYLSLLHFVTVGHSYHLHFP